MIQELNSNQIYTLEDNIIWDKRKEYKTKVINPNTGLEVGFMFYNKEIYYPRASERNTERVNSNKEKRESLLSNGVE